MSSVRAMLAIWVCEAAEPRIELVFREIPRRLDQAAFLRKGLADMAAWRALP